ncbi:signal transduction histidine kinase, nitrogen specific, NtrB [Oleidesulfovibrio alaskensis G20]|jgi:PAS domain S-box-containing protein|uniref:histidine kinase n=1 Tax=Oleidesulfovibrio alaskensis (strain ATCC BAA-1058 / DSM 17464 / G20) TaxID=207559 RepID=Q315N7_OLEA2|nr:ATP-binding protein [Oleidesulfovibrio alaskensis]ABB37359.1 signal transduction histidine kinase, nitrogen specific, NtrB [Oleidesulfovibrio alaskensis G20]MBG0773262.1 PAS domain S-box protein [Oleidesulfovibrio alaskensis]
MPPRITLAPTPKQFVGRSISRDLTISLLVMLMVVVGGMASIQYISHSRTSLEELDNKADEYITRLADILSVPIWNFDTRTIEQIGSVFTQYDLVNEVVIKDPAGHTLFSVTKAPDPDATLIRQRDIFYDGEIIGNVRVVLTLREYKRSLRRMLSTTALTIGGVALVIVLATGVLLRIYLRRPLDVLLSSIDKVSKGDFRHDFSTIQQAELAAIARSFASMSAKVEAREKALQRMNSQLQEEVAERERAEQALRNSEERYSLAVGGTNDGIWDWDLISNKVYFSPRWKEIIGFQDHEIPNEIPEWTSRVHPDDLAKILKAHEMYLSRELPAFEVEYRLRHKDGSYRWILGRGLALWSDADQPYRMAGAHTDITDRKESERELLATKNRLDNILNSMPSLIVGVSDNGIILQWNRTAEEETSVSARDAIGTPFENTLPEFSFLMGKVLQSLNSGETISLERKAITYSDRVRTFDIIIYPVTERGEHSAVIRIDDVTDRIRIEEMMVQTEKMMSVGGLAAGMAHEINNPLGGILQGAQNIVRRISTEIKANHAAADEVGCDLTAIRAYMEKRGITRFLDGIQESGNRAAKIVSNMLEFSRRSESRRQLADMHALMDKTVELAANDYDLKKKYDFRHIELVRDYAPDLPGIHCTPTEIEQVLLNLLKNSAQAMAGRPKDSTEPPRITLRTRLQHDKVCIQVLDNGPGMDEETRKRVFEPFFTTKSVGEGTGLGLSVSYFIITTNHGGSFTVDSEPGKGACFTILLPR